MPRSHGRNVVAAGLFLVLMGTAAVALLIVVGGKGLFEEQTELRIQFDEAPGVKPGGAVLLRGQPVGRVRSVGPVATPCPAPNEDRTCYVIEVVAGLPERFEVFENARIVITQSLVGQTAQVNIQEVGFPQTQGEGPTKVVQGGQESPFAAAAADFGIGKAEKKDIHDILANLKQISADLKKDLPDLMAKANTTTTNMEKLTGDLKTSVPELNKKVLETVDSLREASKQANDGIKKIHAILDENRANVEKAVKHTASFAEKLDADGGKLLKGLDGKTVGEILDNVKAASADLKTAMADLKRVAADGKVLMVTQKGNLAETVQNFRAVSEHLKATAKEVRRAPWRLLAQPDKEEVETLNLYDTARAFGAAAADLDSFSDSLRLVAEAEQAGIEVDPEIVRGMMLRLQETFEKYQEAEEALWKEFERIQK